MIDGVLTLALVHHLIHFIFLYFDQDLIKSQHFRSHSRNFDRIHVYEVHNTVIGSQRHQVVLSFKDLVVVLVTLGVDLLQSGDL